MHANRKFIIKTYEKLKVKDPGDNEELASGHCNFNCQMNASGQDCFRSSGQGGHWTWNHTAMVYLSLFSTIALGMPIKTCILRF